MKIILLQTYETLGQIGEIVNVKAGYARNFLIPNKIASIATDDNIQFYNKWIENQKIKEAKNRKNMELLSSQLDKLTLKFELKAGENDKLFGSVTSQMISDELADKGYTVDKKEIVLEDTIKELGNFKIAINLGYELDTKIKVKVQAAK